jgi:CheY-like chemotaxis protein
LAEVAFSIRSLVESVADSVAEKAEANGVEMICNVSGDTPGAVAGDAGRLRQILQSLVANAVEHTHSGEVSLRAEVTGEMGDSTVIRFEVEDSGDGIGTEALAAIFEPSAQAIAARGRSTRNGRLGLAMSHKLVELMGGQMGVESAPGQGTRFWFAIRLKKRVAANGKADSLAASAEAGADPEKLSSLENRRVLVVDDVASARGVVVEMLQRMGMRVGTASGGHDAVQALLDAAAGGDPFAVAILDYEMPGGNGLETSQAILDLPVGRHTSLILTIPASLRHWRDEPVLEGVQAVISKPVQENALTAALLRCADEIARREPVHALTELNDALNGAERGSDSVEEEAPPRRVVLIAEDNLVNQRVARSLVEKMGYATEVVSDGRQAVDAVAHRRFDLILMDCQMPELDGLSATAEIRAMEGEVRYTPIIAMTANAMRGDRERCLDAGMNDYVSKPVVYETLHSVLSYWLSRSEAAVS